MIEYILVSMCAFCITDNVDTPNANAIIAEKGICDACGREGEVMQWIVLRNSCVAFKGCSSY